MRKIRLLVIEDNPGDQRLIREMLAEIKGVILDAQFVDRLNDGLDCISREQPDLILSDLCLPDSIGIDTFLRLHNAANDIPIILLTGEINEIYALIATKEGVGDYLLKSQIDSKSLGQSIKRIIETHRQKG